MSPLWRDEVAIFLAPRKIALLRRRRGLKPRISAATEIAVAEGSMGDSGPALARLAELLGEPGWQDADARVVIADPWARFAMVPAPASRLDQDARRAHARFVIADIYGEAVTDWQLELQDAPPGRPCLACAMPGGLKADIEAALAPARLKLVSMQPLLVVAFNAWRGRLPPGDLWFMSVEDGWLSAVQLADGAWNRIHAARLSGDSNVEFERMQAFARLTRSAGSSPRIFVEAPPGFRARAARIGSDLEWLEMDAANGGPTHELALLLKVSA